VSKQESVHRVINRKSIGRAVNAGMNREIKTDAAYLANLAERLSDHIGLPLNLAHERVMTLAVSARPRPSAPFFGDRGR
jgi:isopentenyl diphosphate isomerase/L-lactate dehydrogenase-like FMN-dependent dehydrogenase